MKTRNCSNCNSDKYYCKGLCKKCYMKSFVPIAWAKEYKTCVACNSNLSPHVGHGLCSKCYSTQNTELLCACGCGTPVTKRGNKSRRYAKGHWLKSSNNSNLIRMDMFGENNPQYGKFGKNHPAYGHKTTQKTRDERRSRRLKFISERGKITNIESALGTILDKMNITHIPQTVMYEKFSVDEYLPDSNLIIEAYGGYWHGDSRKFPKLSKQQIRTQKKDSSKEKYLNKCGHRVLILWENELLNFPDWCIKEIKLAILKNLLPFTQDSIKGKS